MHLSISVNLFALVTALAALMFLSTTTVPLARQQKHERLVLGVVRAIAVAGGLAAIAGSLAGLVLNLERVFQGGIFFAGFAVCAACNSLLELLKLVYDRGRTAQGSD